MMARAYQPLSDEVLSRLNEIVAWLEKDAQDQFRDLEHFEEMFESISQELPEDIRTSLSSVYGLDTLYAPIKHALRKLRSRPAIEKKKADAEHATAGAQSQVESHKDTLATLQASFDLKIARKTALEAELRSLTAEIEADKAKIAELPGLIEQIQAEAKSAITKVEQCNAELTDLSGTQKDCQELLDNSRLITSNARGVIAKYLNI
jgi:chromosome segregation ATPase